MSKKYGYPSCYNLFQNRNNINGKNNKQIISEADVYSIPRNMCNKIYRGESSWTIKKRIYELTRDCKLGDFRSGWVLWHINYCRLFKAKFSLYICIKYIWFDLVGFYGISIIACYLKPNPFYTYILNIWFGFVGFYGISNIVGYLKINSLYTSTYILNIYDLVWIGFYGISTIVGYLKPNSPRTYIYDLVWLGFMAYQLLKVI